MTDSYAPSASRHDSGSLTRSTDRRVGRRDHWFPLLGLIGFGLVAVVGGAVIDASGLEQSEGSWGYLFAGLVLVVMYGWLPLLATLVTGLAATFAGTEAVRRSAFWVGAGIVSLICLGTLVLVAATAATEPPAGQAYSLILGAGALVAIAPQLVVVGRRIAGS